MTPPPAFPVLYSFRRCPYAMRARLAVRASGVAVALREVVLRAKPAALIAISPKATVPVLQLPDGRVLEQSIDIMRWALALNDPQGWLHDAEQAEVQALVDLNDGPFKQSLDCYKYASRHPEKTAEAWRDQGIDQLLSPLETRLSRHRFLLRDTPSLADMALLPFVRQFAGVDEAWFDTCALPRLRDWKQQLTAAPLFDSVMQKYDAWQAGDAELVF